MKKIFCKLAVILLVVLSFKTVCFADGVFQTTAEQQILPDISAKAYILADARTGEIILSNNESHRLPIASTTKVLTCLIALENSNLDDVVTVKAECCGTEGSSIYLYEGEKLTIKDLLYGLMLESANDAAVCIANYIAGSQEAFASMMNNKAQELGLLNSHFNNPHGLEDPNHYSTAEDMALIWQEAMKNLEFRKIVSTQSYRIDMKNDEYRFLSNHNRLLKTYENCIGGKTGYTKTSGRCLISGASQNGIELVAVTLDAPDDWNDHKALMDYGFSKYKTVDAATDGSISHILPVVGGTKNSVLLRNTDSLTVSVLDISKLKVTVEAPEFCYAPIIDTSTALGRVVYSVDGFELASLPLYPENSINIRKKDSFIKRLINIFK